MLKLHEEVLPSKNPAWRSQSQPAQVEVRIPGAVEAGIMKQRWAGSLGQWDRGRRRWRPKGHDFSLECADEAEQWVLVPLEAGANSVPSHFIIPGDSCVGVYRLLTGRSFLQ